MNSQNKKLIVFTLLSISLTTCSQTDSTENHDELAARAGAPLFTGMGSHEHPGIRSQFIFTPTRSKHPPDLAARKHLQIS